MAAHHSSQVDEGHDIYTIDATVIHSLPADTLLKTTKRSRIVIQPYAPSACSVCKKARTRCEGFPTCKRCERLGHECVRGPDHRKAITRHHEQNLRHQNEELLAQVEKLSETNKALNCEISHLRSQASSSHLQVSPSTSPPSSNFLLPRSLEPQPFSDISDDSRSDQGRKPDPCSESSESESSSDSDGESDAEVINVDGKRNLFREFGQLHKYGTNTPFRSFRRRTPSQRMLRVKRRREESPERTERHVLMLPTLSEREKVSHCKCESHCWARYLPQDVPLTREAHDLLLDRFFLFFGSWCLRIIPEYFLRDMYHYLHAPSSAPPPRTAHYSPFLHLTILALATAFSEDPAISDKTARKKFADLAKARLEDELGAPSLSAVQGLGMLGSYHSGLGQQTLGFVYFGMSARISQALGLGADCAQWVQKGRMKAQDLFNRYWCFHMEVAQDACWALYVGREFGIPVGTNDPFSLVGFADPMLDCMTWRKSGGEPQICRTFTTFLHSCNLMRISGQIMSAMSIISQVDNGSELKILAAKIDMQLLTWRDELPDELKLSPSPTSRRNVLPHVLMMHCSYWWLMILLHRPFYRRKKCGNIDNPFSVGRCNLAAKEILSLIQTWREVYGNVRFAPIDLIQVVFASGTVHLLAAHQSLAIRTARPAIAAHAEALEKVAKAVDILEELGQSWPGAVKIAGIFRKLSDAQRQRMETRMQLLQMKRLTGCKDAVARGSYASYETEKELAEISRPESDDIVRQTAGSSPQEAIHPASTIPFPTSASSQIGFLSGDVNLSSAANGNTNGGLVYASIPGEVMREGQEFELLLPEFPMEDTNVMDFARTGWGMPDGETFPDQPFAVEFGDYATVFNGIPSEFGNYFAADQADAGDRALYELIRTDYI